jgi:hypothetical protein
VLNDETPGVEIYDETLAQVKNGNGIWYTQGKTPAETQANIETSIQQMQKMQSATPVVARRTVGWIVLLNLIAALVIGAYFVFRWRSAYSS